MLSKEEFADELAAVLQKYTGQSMSTRTTGMMRMDVLRFFSIASKGYDHGIDVNVSICPEDRRIDVDFLKNGKRITNIDELYEGLTRYIPKI